MLFQSIAAILALAFDRKSDAENAYPAEMCGPYTEPVYRVELRASQAENSQMVVNVLRRLIGLTVQKTGREAGDEIRRLYRRPDPKCQAPPDAG
jgi:hypothetical protein